MADLQSYEPAFKDRLDELTRKHKVPGAALGIVRDDELLETATGVVNVETGVETTPDTLFQIGSITKVYTASIVMQLVDEGKVDLDEPVATYVPELSLSDPSLATAITVRHLLNHTSGIDGDLFEDCGRGDDCVERYIGLFPTLAQMAPPGSFFSYCNSGFVLAGRLIELLDGCSYDAALKRRLLEPIGATRSTMLPEEAILHRASVGHVVPPGADGPTVVRQWLLPRALGPAGLIAAPVSELLAFARLHLDGGTAGGQQILSSQSVAAMQRAEVRLTDPYTLGQAWGLGWILFEWGAEPVIGHDGSTLGQNAFMRLVPGQRLAVALLTNAPGGRAVYERLFDEVLGELAGLSLPPKPAAAVDQSAYALAPFEGVFERLGVRMTVSTVEGRLQLLIDSTGPLAASQPPTPPIPLDAVDASTFVGFMPAAGVDMAVVFSDFDADGRPGWVHMGGRATKRVG